jgi:hypothetical protein
MPNSKSRLRMMALYFLAGALATSWPLEATEKYWIGHEAEVIFVGTFHPNPTYLWFDGWYLTGFIEVDQILYGEHLPHWVELRFDCTWKRYCQWWPPPRYPELASKPALWFLKRMDQKTWKPALDAGFRELADRADWESYISRHKQHE